MATTESMETDQGLVNGDEHSTTDERMDCEYETEKPKMQNE